jgi:type III secretory pathway lipoprotein EscJ
MGSQKYKLACRVQEGMFESECIVTIPVINEKGEDSEASAFVDKDELQFPQPLEKDAVVDGFLDVSVMGVTSDKVSVVLPSSTFNNGPVVWVKRSNVHV